MVKPVRFGYNPQTAGDNLFQKRGFEEGAQENALREFTNYASLLKANKIDVVIAEDTERPYTPDSIFPNNWFTTHDDGTLVIYPMFAVNRRNERKDRVIEAIYQNFDVKRVVDLTWWETENQFLEGTGSMILDRVNKIVYAGRSPRTCEPVLENFCQEMGYRPILFDAVDSRGGLIYHTNVMMSLGNRFAILCTEAIRDPEQKKIVLDSLEKTGKRIIDLTLDQIDHYAGNMLRLNTTDGKEVLVMSATARKSLTPEQSKLLNGYFRILSPQLDFIEANGGGSARCMLAELF